MSHLCSAWYIYNKFMYSLYTLISHNSELPTHMNFKPPPIPFYPSFLKLNSVHVNPTINRNILLLPMRILLLVHFSNAPSTYSAPVGTCLLTLWRVIWESLTLNQCWKRLTHHTGYTFSFSTLLGNINVTECQTLALCGLGSLPTSGVSCVEFDKKCTTTSTNGLIATDF